MLFKNFGFSMFNIENEFISTLFSSYRIAASFITSKFLEHNTENEEFEKSRLLQKCPLTHITLIMIMIMIGPFNQVTTQANLMRTSQGLHEVKRLN